MSIKASNVNMSLRLVDLDNWLAELAIIASNTTDWPGSHWEAFDVSSQCNTYVYVSRMSIHNVLTKDANHKSMVRISSKGYG